MGQYLTSNQLAALGTAQIHSQGNPYPIPLREIGLGQSPYGEFGNTPAPIDFAKLPMQALAYLLHNANFIKSQIEVLPFFDEDADLSEFAENFEDGKYIYRHLETNFNEPPPVEKYNYIGVKKEQIEFWGSAFESEEAARESIRGPFIPFQTNQIPEWLPFLFFQESMNYDTYNSYAEIESYIYENTETLYLSWQQRLADWKESEILKPQPNQDLIADIDRQEEYRANERLLDLEKINSSIIPDAANLPLNNKISYANFLLGLADNIACKINFSEKLEAYTFAKRSLLKQPENVFRELRHSIRWKNFYVDRNDNSFSSLAFRILSVRNLSFLKCYLGSRIKPLESYSSEQIPAFTSNSIPALQEAEMALRIAMPGVASPFPENIGSADVIKIDYSITYIDDYGPPTQGENGEEIPGDPIYATDELSSSLYLGISPNVLSLKEENCYQRFHPLGLTGWWTRFGIHELNGIAFTFITGIKKNFETEEKEYAGINFYQLFDTVTGEDKDENEILDFAPDILGEWMASTDYVKYVPAVGNPGDPDYQEHKIDASLLRQTWQPHADKIKTEYQAWGTPDDEPLPESPQIPVVVPVGSLELYNKYEQLISSYPLYALDETVAGVNIKYYFSDEYINSKYDWVNDVPVDQFPSGGGGDTLDGGGGDSLGGGGGDSLGGG